MLNIVLNSHACAQLLTPWKKYPKTQILDYGNYENDRFVYANGLHSKRVFWTPPRTRPVSWIHFTLPGTLLRPLRGVGKSDKLAFKITTPVRRIACLSPEPDPKEDPKEFHKGPREDPLEAEPGWTVHPPTCFRK